MNAQRTDKVVAVRIERGVFLTLQEEAFSMGMTHSALVKILLSDALGDDSSRFRADPNADPDEFIKMGVRTDPRLYALLVREAERRNITLAQVTRDLLIDFLEKRKP